MVLTGQYYVLIFTFNIPKNHDFYHGKPLVFVKYTRFFFFLFTSPSQKEKGKLKLTRLRGTDTYKPK